MYFPYVYGRGSELLALRNSCKTYFSDRTVIPVIEPVNLNPDRLARCLEDLGKENCHAVVILNPYQGELTNDVDKKTWFEKIHALLLKHPSLIPAFQCRSNIPLATINSFIQFYPNRAVALLYLNSGLNDSDMKILSGIKNIRFHISLQRKMTAAHMKLLPRSKSVHIVDYFSKQLRNADYSGQETFADAHKNFKDSGIGFGDYTVIGSAMQLGGGPPGAVAIHMTYKKPENAEIWIEHFVSDETDINLGSVGGKYLEALAKLVGSHRVRRNEFGDNEAIDAFLADHAIGHYPGLGKNKERQIHHHIALMHRVLNEIP
jgi:hypothetical protein